ncbi:MAG TPA: A/G-specific adenine glycosylase [Ruminococcaceae bacterium]|nr:A/G-specific adenine glycosylase [Oscillospiraceae bacterium]
METLARAVPLITEHYRQNGRTLPWRENTSPYSVWISEIMLQQTRIEAVIPYYHRFLSALPSVSDLANADEEDLLKLWQGLGYYSRARNLKKAAQVVVEQHGGMLPDDAAALRKLPGIGEYTAGAIASIAYGKPEPAVDGNVLRVVMRLLGCEADILQSQTKKAVNEALKQIYPQGKDAGYFTQGIMELGETVCVPNGAPLCEICPLKSLCNAVATHRTEQLPIRAGKKARRIEPRTVLRLQCGDYLALNKRPNNGLLAKMWELPNELGHRTLAELQERYPNAERITPLPNAKHIFSHVEWHMVGWEILLTEPPRDFTMASAEEIREHFAVPNAFRAYLPSEKR